MAANENAEANELTPLQRAAVVVASLDPKDAAAVLQKLSTEVMLMVTGELQQLGIVPGFVRDRTIASCIEEIQDLGHAVQGDRNLVNALLIETVGHDKASEMMASAEERDDDAFANFTHIGPEQLATILNREQPGIIALVLRYLPSQLAADVLSLLPLEISQKVIVFLCTSENPSKEVVQRVEKLLSAKLGPNRKVSRFSESDKLDMVSSILQHAKRSVEEELLTAIEQKSEHMANDIRDRLFTFEDIVRLDNDAMRKILSEVEMNALAISLRAASPELRDKFFDNLSKRAVEGLKEEMEFSQKVKITDVEQKQREIVNAIRTLETSGQITIGSGGDEYV